MLAAVGCWPLWAVDDELISILAVIVHRVIFLDQAKGQYVFYSLGVIPHRIRISWEITNIVGGFTSALQWTRRYCPSGASLMFDSYFPLINALHVDWLSIMHQFS